MSIHTASDRDLRALAKWGSSEYAEQAQAELVRRQNLKLQGGEASSRVAHNHEIAGESPAPATSFTPKNKDGVSKDGVHGGVVNGAPTGSTLYTTPPAPLKGRWDA